MPRQRWNTGGMAGPILDSAQPRTYPATVCSDRPATPVLDAAKGIKLPQDGARETRGHRLGPLLYRVSAQQPAKARFIATLLLAGCLALFVLAARLQPDDRGVGTHQQLGLAPCSLVVMTGFPCPTCGMTTAFAYAVRGRFVAAFDAQPAGLAAAIATFAVALAAAAVIATGKVWVVNWLRVSPGLLVGALIAVFLGGWLYKVATGLWDGTLPIRR